LVVNRRNFLSLAALAVAGEAAVRVWPFRVFSIPKEIVAPKEILTPQELLDEYMDRLACGMVITNQEICGPLIVEPYNGPLNRMPMACRELKLFWSRGISSSYRSASYRT
jgi:hypothetical protein